MGNTVSAASAKRTLSDFSSYTKQLIMNNTNSMHISCKMNTQNILEISDDCVGLAVFLDNDGKVVEDNGVRVRSGYIVVSNKFTAHDQITAHSQLYNAVFKDIKDRSDCYIFGFAMKDNCLLGRSGTFNSSNDSVQRILQDADGREGLFYFRLVTFGAILCYKLCGKRNITPYTCALCVCLHQIISQCWFGGEMPIQYGHGDKVEIEHLSHMREIFDQLGVPREILEVTCDYDQISPWFPIYRWFRAKSAINMLFKAIRQDMDEHEFRRFMSSLLDIFSYIKILVELIRDALKDLL